jgi:hypothetical protein
LLRQFFRVKQVDGVADFIERFDSIVHQILAHDPKFSTATITNHFIDGLKDDIRAVVLVHRPSNLDTASAIALLQEESSKDAPRKDFKRNEMGGSFRYSSRASAVNYKNSVAYQAHNKGESSTSHGRRGSDNAKNSYTEDKAATLMNYKKLKGLCYKCVMKWNPDHKCANTVPLNVVEELWQMVSGKDASEVVLTEPDEDSGDDLMAISVNAVQGTKSCTTVRVIRDLCGREVVILIDSGSSHSFISESLASRWREWSVLPNSMQVRVANGHTLECTHEIVACPMWISGYAFKMTLKVLPLQCYDMILGMDWLAQHSPMEVDWNTKWMSFDYQGAKMLLQEISPKTVHCELITKELVALEQQDKLWCILKPQAVSTTSSPSMPQDIQEIVDQYSDLFVSPSGLPPKRSLFTLFH